MGAFNMEKDVVGSYLNSIKTFSLLSAEEESELSVKIQKGDKAALQRLINSNLRLVVSLARRMQVSSSLIMDLIQEGNLGLMVAAEKFRADFKTRFSTYAYPWIAQYMLRYLNIRTSFISLPNRKELMIRKIQKAQTYFFQQNGREACVSELAIVTGIPEDKVVEYLNYSYTVASLDVEVSDEGNSATIGDLLPDMTFSPEEQIMKDETKKTVTALMNSLPAKERNVLWYRYNFDGDMHTKTLREVSKIVGVSPEAVRQTEIRAVKHMKAAVEKSLAV